MGGEGVGLAGVRRVGWWARVGRCWGMRWWVECASRVDMDTLF